MKALAVYGLCVSVLGSLFAGSAHACSMTALSGTTYLMKRVSQHVSETSPLETSVDRIELNGFSARVQLTSGDGQCSVEAFQITFDDRCVASVTPLGVQPEPCNAAMTQ